MASATASASIIVPAFREAANLRALTQRVFAAVRAAGIEAELIIVDDDSQDGTPEVIDFLKQDYPIRLVIRTHERGLSGAVLRGFREARFDCFVVLDADLQHPPECIPELLGRLENAGCDFALATRYGPGARIGKRWPWHRRWGSRLATLLSRPLTPASDPMSGFFALRRDVWKRAKNLNTIGYKIALELMVRGRCRGLEEVPIEFTERAAGESKLGVGVSMAYLLQLGPLYWFRYFKVFILLLILGIASLGAWVAIQK